MTQLVAYIRTWSALDRYIQQHGENPVDALLLELAAAWGDPGQNRLITWPLILRAGKIQIP